MLAAAAAAELLLRVRAEQVVEEPEQLAPQTETQELQILVAVVVVAETLPTA